MFILSCYSFAVEIVTTCPQCAEVGYLWWSLSLFTTLRFILGYIIKLIILLVIVFILILSGDCVTTLTVVDSLRLTITDKPTIVMWSDCNADVITI